MKIQRLVLGAVLLVAVCSLPGHAQAQLDDLLRPRPVVMLGIDTSGSMEYLVDDTLPSCSGVPGSDEYNRFNIALEALTGTFSTYTCADRDRSVSYVGQIDESYYLHHYPPTAAAIASQIDNGVLDTYRERIKFGLMTFDSWGGGPTYPDPAGVSDDATGMFSYGHDHRYQCQPDLDGDGMADCAGWNYLWDAGARRACDMPAPSASCPLGKDVIGGMISVGDSDVQADIDAVNNYIQLELLSARPFGATPLAALLDDIHLYFARNTDVNGFGGKGAKKGGAAKHGNADGESDDDVVPVDHGFGTVAGSDAYAPCRDKFAVLFTDGIANVDARPFCSNYPSGPGYGCDCPYGTAPEQAQMLADDGVPLFVIGFAVQAATPLEQLQIRRSLWDIAEAGDTAEPCDDACAPNDVACHVNLMASPPTCPVVVNPAAGIYHTGAIIVDCNPADPSTCRADVAASFSSIFDAFGSTSTSRTMPVQSTASSDPNDPSAAVTMDEFTARFTVNAGYPWQGALARAHWECQAGTLTLRNPPDPADDLTDRLNKRAAPRNIYTFDPTAGAGDLRNSLQATDGTDIPFTKGIAPGYFGVGTGAERDDIVDFVRADNGFRTNARLGDIFHSAPVVHPRLEARFGSQSYTDFVIDQDDRVPVLFVGTNDGILHAFNTMPETADGGGDELWGFVPPFHVPNLGAQMPSNHQFYMDATVSVADVLPVFRRGAPAPAGTDWRTVVIAGMRQGGNAYVALDVTDSLKQVPDPPEMLWQITGPEFGDTYGGAQIAKVFAQLPTETEPAERAVAVLVGGQGSLAATSDCNRQATNSPAKLAGYVGGKVHCWNNEGRYLRIVDLMTGDLIREWGPSNYGGVADPDNPIDSPLIGTPAIFLQGFDVTMKRAFITDADGTIWRLQTDNQDPSQWKFEIFYDVFYDRGSSKDRSISNEQPALTTDPLGRVVVLVGTGDPDNLGGKVTFRNRAVSVTEQLVIDAAGVNTSWSPIMNWRLDMPDNDEKVTGAVTVTDETAYLTSYVPGPATSKNACVRGYARIWGVDYIKSTGGATNPPVAKLFLDMDGNAANGNETAGSVQGGRAEDMGLGTVLFGLQAVRKPSCVETNNLVDPLGFARDQILSVSPAEWELVAQMPGGVGPPPAFAQGGGAPGSIAIRQAARVMRTRVDSWGALVE